MKDSPVGAVRTYLVLKEKARQWNEDAEIKALLAEDCGDERQPERGKILAGHAKELLAQNFDRARSPGRD